MGLDNRVYSLEAAVRDLFRQLRGAPLRPASGGGRGAPRWVKVLPPIPTGRGYDEVTWCSPESLDGGTGDDNIWEASALYGEWTPRGYLTSLSGVPVPPEEE